jgi:hypothetical protein
MNNKFGREGGYREDRFRNNPEYQREREARENFWRDVDDDRALRSPDQEFETSGNYREPYGETYTSRDPRGYGRPGYPADHAGGGRGRFDGVYAPSYPSPSARGRSTYETPRRGGYAGRGPKDYVRTDERIREDVCERLSWNDEVDATDITVRVAGGEVTLEGSVETRHMKRLAEDLAEDVLGVSDVHNTIRVRKPILTEIKEKLTGEGREEHYANTGTKTTSGGAGSVHNGVT